MKKISVGKIVIYLVLAVIAFIWVYPFLWMVSASFKTQSEFFGSGLNLIPQAFHFDNFIRAWNNANFGVYFKNTIIVTISVVAIVLMSTSLAGYVIGRYAFIGKKVILGIFMASITIPLVFTVIPVYELLKELGLEQSLIGLILAESGGGHVIFLMLFSSFYASIPNEMEEAATIDGCGFFQTYAKIMFPLAKPIMVTVVTMQSIWTWNSFLLPLIVTLNNPEIRTLAVGLYALRGENVVDWTGIAAGACIAIVPIVILFVSLQKYFVDGIAGAVKS
ncbi:carbohydrate ABC transporter permease [Anaerobium acetethylicum]|uniref:Raffinose/stachyose/melibiose transport system permease protein n=1 Tax=Anaerobium acetethylicum TaxID=1619234 RepID=A0A1D3TU07_9FIRM|nr:carbohydrate ABC transporter permease [Anaerobium acetethylicum]SCP97517.1 raffinose/stachyose/melibiose transport system permease protein [Anaerobium acetethylicum]